MATDADRRAYVRDWIARRLNGKAMAATGLLGTVLSLPMVAAAQAAQQFVRADGIAGVSDVQVMDDGSVQLQMSNGMTVSVPASDVRITDAGDVLVSDRIVEVAADVMAAAEGGGLGGGAIAAGLGGAAVAAAAAGGGGGSDGGSAPPPVLNGESFQSQVLGISGGFNSENTGITPPEGTTTIEVTITDEEGGETFFEVEPDEDGNWTTPDLGDDSPPQGNVTVTVRSLDEGGEELDSTTQDFVVDTVAPEITIGDTGVGGDGVLNITEQDAGITISGATDAEDGQTVTVTVGAEEFTATASGGEWSVTVPAGSLAGLGDDATVNITANVEDAAGNTADEATDSFTTDLSAGITLDTIAGKDVGDAGTEITAADRVGGFEVVGTVEDVENGQPVTVTINGQDFAGTVAGGAFTVEIDDQAFLDGLGNGPTTLNVSASVTDEAGNEATTPPASIAADFTGPSIAIDPIPTADGDNTLNIEERADGFEISGTTDRVAPGSTVTVTVNGEPLAGPVTVDANGDWSVIVDQGDGGTFPQNGPVTIEADVTDDESGLEESAAPLELDADLEAPAVTITDTGVGDDNTLNLAEQDAGITISGTTTGVEDTQQVEVRLFDGGILVPGGGGDFYLADVDGNGDWSVVIPDTTLAQFSGDGTIEVTANVSDAAGNAAPEDEQSFNRDLTAPTISFNDISGDNQIGLLDVQGNLEITGTTSAEVNQPVTLTFNGQDFNGSVISNSLGGAEPNAWSVTVPQSAVVAIQTQADTGDGTLSNIPVSVTVSDLAGNAATAPAETTIDADFNGPSITIDDIAGDNIVNATEAGENIIFSGTVNNVPDTQEVTLNVGSLELSVGISGGFWQTSLTPQQATDAGLTDGATVDITADVTDGDGVPAPQATAQITADFTAPEVFFDTIAESVSPGDDTDNFLNEDALANGIDLSGHATGATDGTVEIFFGAGDQFPSIANVDSDGNWSLGFTGNVVDSNFPAGAGDRVQDFIVVAVDEAGNRSDPVTRTVTLDVTPPEILIDAISGDDEIGLLDVQGDLEISGTTDAEVGQEVTLTFNGQTFTGSVLGSGLPAGLPNFWGVDVPQSVIEALQTQADAGDGTLNGISVTATVTDVAGNPATTPATSMIGADFNAPSITIDPITGDNVINAEESGGDVTISGSTERVGEGQDVTVSVDGTPLPTVQTDPTGAWQVTLLQADLPADGASVSITADVSDDDGIAAPQASETLSADLTAPGISFDIIRENIAGSDDPGDDGFLNAAARTDGIEFIGSTTNAQAGDTVELSFAGSGFGDIDDFGVGSATVQADGSWRIGFESGPVPVFFPVANGEGPVDFAVVVIDAAGNRSAPVTRTMTLDETPPGVTIDSLESDGQALGPVMNIAESGEDLVISGTVNGADDVTVTLNGTELTGVTVNSGGWEVTVPFATLTGLGTDATVEIIASATDTAGNTGTSDPASFTTDFTPPTIEITDTGVGPDDILNIAESDAGITITGNVTGAEGETVTVTLSGVAPGPITATGPVTGGTFAVLFDDVALDGLSGWASATVTADVSDAAGNPATPATGGFDIDVTAPTIAFDDPPPQPFTLDIEEREMADGIDFTTSETSGANVTLTFTHSDGTADIDKTVALDTLTPDAGLFTLPLTEQEVDGLRDLSDYTVAITITDAAGNVAETPPSFDISTDFAPILTIDPIGEDGAVDLSDTADASITGTTVGVEPGQQVTVVITAASGATLLDTSPGADNIDVQVDANGDWTFDVPQSAIDALEPGETFTVAANVENAAGRAADEASADIDAYLATGYNFVNTEENGSTLTIVANGNENLDASAGLGIDTTLTFDTADASFALGSTTAILSGLLPLPNENNAASGEVIFGGLVATPFTLPAELYGFEIESQDAGPITLSFVDDEQGGPTELQIGTSGGDTLTASNIDSVIQGKGGDDSIDVSATGTDVVVFELDQASNGTDTVTGFTLGNTFQSDVMAFLGEADLRGGGTDVESLGNGGPLGADTGFVIFTNALGGTDATALETAFEGLTGEAAGDEVYFLAGDGTDAALARVTVAAPDDASVEILANFSDIGDLNQLSPDNVILPDPVTIAVT
ncbi:Ig-like domain-containing protein [Roseovarius ramblicola]|uniref:Ig-like domain-containing protein n=1 Tax=Roseovarius ramblicola TaxID=2022336 RepID=A0ABV5I037_9RHOB